MWCSAITSKNCHDNGIWRTLLWQDSQQNHGMYTCDLSWHLLFHKALEVGLAESNYSVDNSFPRSIDTMCGISPMNSRDMVFSCSLFYLKIRSYWSNYSLSCQDSMPYL